MATFSLDTGTVPEGTPFPSTVQGFLELLKSYVEVTGLGESEEGNLLAGILKQSTKPAMGQADMLWVQTSSGGRPAALKAYQQDDWKSLSTIASGTTEARPSNALVGEFYYDTDIKCLLIYGSSGWSTAEGSIGDIKFSHATDQAQVLLRNPGWEIYTAAQGKSLVAIDPLDTENIGGTNVYQTPGNTLGSKTHALTESQMPQHTHTYIDRHIMIDGQFDSDNSGLDADNMTNTTRTTDPTGGDANGNTVPHENRPPLITAFCLKKEF